MSLRRPVTAVTLGFGIALTIPFLASAHANSVTCVDQATSTWRITNDYPLAESFTSPQGPTGTVAAGNGSYTDVVYVGDSLQIDAEWSDGFTESRTGTGDCTPEGGTTTTTEIVTTTTEQETTTSTTTTVTTAPTSTTVPGSTTTLPGSTTSSEPTTTTPTTEPATSSSVATTSTTSLPPPTSPPTSTTTPATSVPPPAPSSATPECSDNPNTPTDDCAPICTPVTQPDGTNSCGPSLPPTGLSDWTIGLIPAAAACILCGAAIILFNRRGIQR